MNKKAIILTVSVFVAVLALGFGLKKILSRPKEVVEEVPAKAKVAIVIDDWGYNLRCIDLLKQIEVPITISILPNLKYSTKIAKIAKDLGQEIILHLPLEPEMEGRDYIGLEQNTITTEMSEEEVLANLEQAFSSVPKISGVSNHMGSSATKDSKLMALIFTELKKRNLFFLDNLVVNESICEQLAQDMKVKFTSRDIFLDNLDDSKYIKEQFNQLSTHALLTNHAVGIGHARARTLQILKEQIPPMQAKGIKFVFVVDLVE